jgi:hypothetical protein
MKQRVLGAMLMMGLFGVLLLGVKLLWPSPHGPSQGLSSVIVGVSIQSVIMGFGFVFLRFKPSKKYRIIVDENQMTASGGSSLPFRWSVRRGEVRTLIERKGNPRAACTNNFETRTLWYVDVGWYLDP